jgi:cardiolipin synthase
MVQDLLALLAAPGSWWLGAVVLALDVLAIGRALLRNHGVESTLAWIMAIVAFPGIGAVAYLLAANPIVRRPTRPRRPAAEPARAAVATPGAGATGVADGLLRIAASLTGTAATAGNEVSVLAESEDAFRRIEGALAAARRSIWAEYYLVRNDETGHGFLAALAAAAGRGVEVRLLYDAVGSLGLDGGRLAAIRAAGGRVAPFLPINPLRRRWSVHLRNHRKLVIVDGEAAFTGGMNIGDEYSGRSRRRGGTHFVDTHLDVRGPAVLGLAAVFADDWHFSTNENLACAEAPPPAGLASVAIVPSGPDQELNASALAYFTGITLARERCFLTTPYFIPDEPTMRALVAAAQRGVDVRLLVPARCDVPLVGAAARASFPRLLRGGVRVLEYLPSMLHAKTLVADGEAAIVGSANVDIRSFRFNFELGAVAADAAVAASLERRFLEAAEAAREVTAADVARASLPRRILNGVSRLLSPLL